MNKTEKNPYDPDAPEWQILERIRSLKLLIISHQGDMERAQRRMIEATNQLPIWEAALEKLTSKKV